jgi:hypothetical protein
VDRPGAPAILAAIDRPSRKLDTKSPSHIRNASGEPDRPPGRVSGDEIELMVLREPFDLGDVIRSCGMSRLEPFMPDVVPARERLRSDGLHPLQAATRELGAQQDADIDALRRIGATNHVGARNGLTMTAAQDDGLPIGRHSTPWGPQRHRSITSTLRRWRMHTPALCRPQALAR